MTAVVKWVFEDYWQSQTQTVTHYYSGAAVDFVVPDTTSIIQAVLRGGAGGGNINDKVAGGGVMVVQFPVTPGETLRLRVGGDGSRTTPGAAGVAGAFNGGGSGGTGSSSTHTGGYNGGGATDIRQGGDALASRIVVAAGAGGNSGQGTSQGGGRGGPDVGGQGQSMLGSVSGPGSIDIATMAMLWGGHGGTQTAGGTGGLGSGSSANGALGVGGVGNASSVNGAGGGGGGLYGGGGGGTYGPPAVSAGGGGGSNGYGSGVIVLANGGGTYARYLDAPMISLEYTETADRYVMDINPNDGGAVTIQKNVLMNQTVGPNRVNILQEGTSQAPLISFSGVILHQSQLEAMEKWFDRRVFLKMTDDLGREYYGIFSKWTPKRQRRASNFWYHTYDAEFTVSGYKNASGEWIYGRVG